MGDDFFAKGISIQDSGTTEFRCEYISATYDPEYSLGGNRMRVD